MPRHAACNGTALTRFAMCSATLPLALRGTHYRRVLRRPSGRLTMGFLLSLSIALAVVLLAPAAAFAQPTDPAVYVCTPDGVVYQIVNGKSTKLYNDNNVHFFHCDL